MLRVNTSLKLSAVEAALRQAAQRHGAQVLSVIHLGPLLKGARSGPSRDAAVFSVCQPDLAGALLSADLRFSTYLPCRVAAYEQAGGVVLEAISPTEACRLLALPEQEPMAMLLESTLAQIMQEASQPVAAHAPAVARHGDVGATEGQVNVRGAIPQRIDCRGTKVEDLAGTGEHDSPGG